MDQETKVLLYCLGPETDEIRSAWLKQLSPSDWESVIQQAAGHGVTPLLYQHLEALGSDTTIPASVVQRLREKYIHSAWKNARLCHELSKVLAALQKDGIPVIVLKGAHLAQVVYGNIALRPMSDVDLLVNKTDLSRVEEKLLDMGYDLFSRASIETCFTKPGAPLVEIHWTIMWLSSPIKVDVDGLWKRAQPAAIAGVNVRVLSPEDLLLHVCVHASFCHVFCFGLRPFCDISETIQHYQDEIDWEQVQRRAHQWKAGKHVYLTLHLARELLGAAVPDEVLETLKPDGFDPLVIAWAREQIFSDFASLSPSFTRLWGPRRLQDKATLFLKSVFLSPEAMAQMYPAPPDSPRIYLYYPVRLKDLLLRYGRAAWRMLHRDEEMVALVETRNKLRDWLASA